MERISTTIKGREIHLVWKPDASNIPELMAQGFIPIEMAEGSVSYVDHLELDHHNNYSHYPSACITALKHYGIVKPEEPARFLANHTDADCVVTALTLMGLLPEEFLAQFNPIVGKMDVDPLDTESGDRTLRTLVAGWRAGMAGPKESGWSWIFGVRLFIDLVEDSATYAPFLNQLAEREAHRLEVAREEYTKALFGLSGRVLFLKSSVWGFDVHFGRNYDAPVDSLDGWNHWCVAALMEKNGAVTVSCPNERIAEIVFGKGGLMNVFPHMPQIGSGNWGGRVSVGGSPRGQIVPEALGEEIVHKIEERLLF